MYFRKVESNDELKEIIGIKNCTRYYFDNIITTLNLDFDNILIDETSCKKCFGLCHFVQNVIWSKNTVY